MENLRLGKEQLWDILEIWNGYMRGPLHLVACGGTAMTLQNIKESTKDVDFLVPRIKQYIALIQMIQKIGYRIVTNFGWSKGDQFIFDLFPGKKIYTTELLSSPGNRGNHIVLHSLSKIKVSALNDYDLITSKIFRSSPVDIEDCLGLIHHRGKNFDIQRLRRRYTETAKYVINEERMISNLENLLRRI